MDALRPLTRALSLGGSQASVSLVRGEPWQLRVVAEHLHSIEQGFEAVRSAARLPSASNGALVLVGIDEDGARWLNLHRSLIAAHALRLVLWMPRRFSLRALAPDLESWTRVIADLPAAPPAHAVTALVGAPGGRVRWHGPDLDRVAAAAWPGARLRHVAVGNDIVSLSPLESRDVPVISGITGQRHLRTLLMALAEGRVPGRIVLLDPDAPTAAFTEASAAVVSWDEASALAGSDRAAALEGLAPVKPARWPRSVSTTPPDLDTPDADWELWAYACLTAPPSRLPSVTGDVGLGLLRIEPSGRVTGRAALDALTAVIARWPESDPAVTGAIRDFWAALSGPSLSNRSARLWIQRGGAVSVHDGFVELPVVPLHAEVTETHNLTDAATQILLGEPGAGKSTELRRLALVCAARHPDDAVHLVDLRVVGSHDHLREVLASVPPAPTGGRLWLLLDSFDECSLRVNSINEVISDALARQDPPPMVRIACRAGAWPVSLEDDLASIRPRGSPERRSVDVLELLPLRRVDVKAWAQREGRDGDAFLDAVRRAGLGALAARPVTLRLLLTKADGAALPTTRAELYRLGVRHLAQECNDRRRDTAPDPARVRRRVAAAGRIATVLLLGGYTDVALDGDDGGPGSLSLEALRGPDHDRGATWSMDEAVLDDAVRNTALFSLVGPRRRRFDHHTFAEYLAASHLVDHGFTGAAGVELLWTAGHGAVAPHLHGIAAWLAALSPEACQYLADRDWMVLLRADPSALDDATRATLVDRVIAARANGESAEDIQADFAVFHNLAHPDIKAQLAAALAPRPDLPDTCALAARRTAARIARQTRQYALAPRLLEIALDSTEPHPLRVAVAEAAKELDPKLAHTDAWLRLARGEAGPDPYFELRGVALLALWPARRDLVDLAEALDVPTHGSFFGMFRSFCLTVPKHVAPEELPILIRLHAQLGQRWLEDGASDLWSPIFEAAWRVAPTRPDVLRALVDWAYASLEQVDSTPPVPEDAATRRLFIETIVADPRCTEVTLWCVAFNMAGVLRTADLAWAIEQFRAAATTLLRINYRDATRVCFDPANDEEAAILRAACDDLPELRAWWGPAYFDRAPEPPAQPEEPPLIEPPPASRVAAALRRCKADPRQFIDVLNQLTLEPRSTHYGDPFHGDVRDLPGWQHAEASTRARICSCAVRFLEATDPEPATWFGTNKLPFRALAGLQAALLLLSEDPGSLPTGAPLWRAWAATFVELASLSRPTDATPLAQRAAREAPDAVLAGLALRLAQASGDNDYERALHHADAVWSPAIAAMVRAEVGRDDLPPKRRAAALALWLSHQDSAAPTAPWEADPSLPVDVRVVGAVYRFRYSGPSLPVDWWRQIATDEGLAEAVSLGLNDWRLRWPATWVAAPAPVVRDLYLWLTKRRDPAASAWMESDHAVTTGPADWREELRLKLPNWLADRAERTDIEALEHLTKAHSSLVYFLDQARKKHLRNAWRPLSPAEVLDRLRSGPTPGQRAEAAPPSVGPSGGSLPKKPFALISYRHEGDAHSDAVAKLVADLRASGLTVVVDTDHALHGAPPEGWTAWMQHAVERAACVVSVWSPGYRAAWDDHGVIVSGRGVRWESRAIRTRFYDNEDWRRWVAVVLDPEHLASVPALIKNDYAVHVWPDGAPQISARLAAWLAAPSPSVG